MPSRSNAINDGDHGVKLPSGQVADLPRGVKAAVSFQ
jgi:hypothetical protein